MLQDDPSFRRLDLKQLLLTLTIYILSRASSTILNAVLLLEENLASMNISTKSNLVQKAESTDEIFVIDKNNLLHVAMINLL